MAVFCSNAAASPHCPLCRGSFGNVYTARHKKSGKQFAIKVMDRVKIKPASIVREYTVLEAVGEHPSVVGYFGTYKTAHTVSFVLEHMQGGELFERLIAEGAFEESQARYTFQRVAQGLAYLHRAGIIHRDLKPENLLLKTALPDDAKIADFGLSQLIKPGERLLKVCGTWAYAAPEMSSSKKPGYSTRFDTWSFGVILYVVLSGSHPFDPQGGLPVAKIKANARAARFSFDQPEWATVSNVAKDFIRRLIVKDQRKRLSSKQMLKHPWLKHVPEPTTRYRLTEDGEKIVERLRAAGSSEYDSSATPSDFEDIEPPSGGRKGRVKSARGRKGTSNTADPFGPRGGGATADTAVGDTGTMQSHGSHLYGPRPATGQTRAAGTFSADSGTASPRPPAAASRSRSRDMHAHELPHEGEATNWAFEAAVRPPDALPGVSSTGEVYNSGASRRQPRAVRPVDVAMPVEPAPSSRTRSFARPPAKAQAASGMPPVGAIVAAKAPQNAAAVSDKKHRQAVGKRLGRAFYKVPPITTGTVTASVGSQDTAIESISDMTNAPRAPAQPPAASGAGGSDAADGAAQLKYPQSSARKVRKQKRGAKDARHFRQSRGEDVMAADIAAAARTATGMSDNDSVLSMDSTAYGGQHLQVQAVRQQSLPATLPHNIRPAGSASSELQPNVERSRTNTTQVVGVPLPAGVSPGRGTQDSPPKVGGRLGGGLLPASHGSFVAEQDGLYGGSIDIGDSASVGAHAVGHLQSEVVAGRPVRGEESLDAAASTSIRPHHGRHLSPIRGKEGHGKPPGLPPRSPQSNTKFSDLR